MFEITVEAGFSSGHYLRNYQGKCENPHGHNYRVLVTLAGAELDEAGLLLDFKLLKNLLPSGDGAAGRPDDQRHAAVYRVEPLGGNPGALFLHETSQQLQRDDRRASEGKGLHPFRD